ncbi:MAG TPA: enoyl-CoA hydratase/isomerase family protein [Beijerinckiaceae bacterium]|nr:enoyl-CoA hydratase/isomerase family protein [Beijerinckiaceae bacterium]
MTDYVLLEIQRADQIATIVLKRIEKSLREKMGKGGAQRAAEVGRALAELREDPSVRVIVFTGHEDVFTIPPSSYGHHGNPGGDWDIMSGVTRAVEAMCTIEKPVIAKVNGHAVGFGANLVLGCDFIVAREDAIIADHHMSAGDLVIDGERKGSADHCMTPGDGGSIFAPLKMPLAIAKEYLMLGRPFTARELAQMGVVNYAVPAAELDAKTDELARALLRRNAYALAMTKRLLNRRALMEFAAQHDAALGYEFLNFYMQTPEAKARGGGRGEDRL